MLKRLRPPQRGDRAVSAEYLRTLHDELNRQGKLNVDGGAYVDAEAGTGVHVALPPPRVAFWAEIIADYGGGWYAWWEVERTALGVFVKRPHGREEDGLNPALEVQYTENIPVGTYVWLTPGFGMVIAGGVYQEWLFEFGAGGGETGFWARITSANCTQGVFGITEISPAAGGTWQDTPGGVTSSNAYHAQKALGPFAAGGPLVAVGTRVWVREGFLNGSTQEYVFDCPAGFTGITEVVGRWRCVGNPPAPEVLPYFIFWHNGQAWKQPCHVTSTPICSPCPPNPP